MNKPDIPIVRIEKGSAPTPLSGDSMDSLRVERRFLEHFGLSEQPFGVTPDPRFLYLGPKHQQALTALTFGTELNRGFLTLIAKPGMGKTSLLFHFLEGLRDNARTVFVFHTDGDSRDLMFYMLADLGLDGTGKDLPQMHSMLNQVLTEDMRAGRRFVLVIDEAQNLTDKVLESVRLLSNFETPWMKLMQIVLAGQPQLADRIDKPSMTQLRQRISFAIRIEPFIEDEVNLYVDHRLWVAGYNGPSLFSAGARSLLAERSEGIPRNINNICFCAMAFCWAMKQKTIDREMMRDILADMNVGPPQEKTEFAPKPADRPKPRVSQNVRPTALTAKDPPARGWLPKATVAGAVLFALGWAGVHFDFWTRLPSALHAISTADKSSVVPPPATVSLDSTLTGSNSSLSGPEPETSTTDKASGAPEQDAIQALPSSR